MNAPRKRLQYLTWSSFLIDTGREIIMIDPFLTGDSELGIPAATEGVVSPLPAADFVVVSHTANDHFGEAVEILRASGGTLCCGVDSAIVAIDLGFPEERIAVLVPGSGLSGAGWSVKALEARHISIRRVGDSFVTGTPLSFLFDIGGVRIFHGGDTALSPDLAFYGDLYQPQIALLGVDGVVRNGRTIVELSPPEAALAAQMLQASIAIPMHYRPSSGMAEAFLDELVSEGRSCRGLRLGFGEWLDLSTALSES